MNQDRAPPLDAKIHRRRIGSGCGQRHFASGRLATAFHAESDFLAALGVDHWADFIEVEDRCAVDVGNKIASLQSRLISKASANHESDAGNNAWPDLDFAQSGATPVGDCGFSPTALECDLLPFA